ncbi:MAG: hypothetical protein FJX29_10265, partial [Alphaproteobacteria bacterium]|nr:hypothetical protein [Alphaproteobacteria bacterium]
ASPTFASGVFDTQTIAREFAPHFEGRRASALAVRLGALAVFAARWPAALVEAEQPSPWAQGAAGERRLKLLVDGEPAECLVRHDGDLRRARAVFDGESDYAALQGAIESYMLIAHGADAYVFEDGGMWHVQPAPAETGGREDGERDSAVRAPMHGRLTAVLVKPGEKVLRGQRLAIVEAMKMEHVLAAPFDGTVTDIDVADGAQVMQGACVVRIAAGSEISGGRK